MRGMNAETGERLSGLGHLAQSIRDVLTTPRGSRVMRRNYGSGLMELLDRPLDKTLVADLQAAVAMALGDQEPRLRLTRVSVVLPGEGERGQEIFEGRISLCVEGYYVSENRPVTLDAIRLG